MHINFHTIWCIEDECWMVRACHASCAQRIKVGRVAGWLTRRKRQNGTMRNPLAEQYTLRMFRETNCFLSPRSRYCCLGFNAKALFFGILYPAVTKCIFSSVHVCVKLDLCFGLRNQQNDCVVNLQLHPRHLGYEVTKQQFSSSLQDLNTSYLDLFLLHYPRCFSAICSDVKHPGSWQERCGYNSLRYTFCTIVLLVVSNFQLHASIKACAQSC